MDIQVERNPRGVAVPYAELTQSATAIANNSFASPNFTSATFDNGAATCGTALADLANERIYLRRAGVWVVTAYANWAVNATGYRAIYLSNPSGLGSIGGELNDNMGAFLGVDQGATAICCVANATSYIGMTLYQNSGGNLNATATLKATWLGAF